MNEANFRGKKKQTFQTLDFDDDYILNRPTLYNRSEPQIVLRALAVVFESAVTFLESVFILMVFKFLS